MIDCLCTRIIRDELLSLLDKNLLSLFMKLGFPYRLEMLPVQRPTTTSRTSRTNYPTGIKFDYTIDKPIGWRTIMKSLLTTSKARNSSQTIYQPSSFCT